MKVISFQIAGLIIAMTGLMIAYNPPTFDAFAITLYCLYYLRHLIYEREITFNFVSVVLILLLMYTRLIVSYVT